MRACAVSGSAMSSDPVQTMDPDPNGVGGIAVAIHVLWLRSNTANPDSVNPFPSTATRSDMHAILGVEPNRTLVSSGPGSQVRDVRSKAYADGKTYPSFIPPDELPVYRGSSSRIRPRLSYFEVRP